MSARDVALALTVMLLWALCYPLITTLVDAAPPLLLGGMRGLLAGTALLLVGRVCKRPPPPAATWGLIVLAGLGLTTMGFAGMFLAGGRISPGVATVLSNTQPLIAAGLAMLLLHERLGIARSVAMVFGLAGIVLVAVNAAGSHASGTSITGIGLVLVGATGVAVGNVALKRAASRVDAITAGGWQLVIGAAPLALGGLVLESTTQISWSMDFAIVLGVLATAGTALAFVLWIDLLTRNDLVQLNLFSFATPIFGLLIASVFYDERLGLLEWGGVALVLLAVVAGAWPSRTPVPRDTGPPVAARRQRA